MRMSLIPKSKIGSAKGYIASIILALIAVVFLYGVGATFFGQNITGAPTWFNTVLPVTIAGGLAYGVYKMFF